MIYSSETSGADQEEELDEVRMTKKRENGWKE